MALIECVLSYGGRVLENYSAGAKRVVASATTEARQLGHPRVGTEHLLLGLLSEDDSTPAAALRAAGARLPAARHTVVEVVVVEAGSVAGDDLSLTPRAQRALERAGRFSRQERSAEVTERHVLLGLLDVEGLACQVLRGLDVDIVRLRDAVAGGADADTGTDSMQADEQPDHAAIRPRCPRCGASLDQTLAETSVTARDDANQPKPVTVVFCRACGTALGVGQP
jgi:ATP-dependent Clp protease ATP-binding subunit ClpC